MQGIISRAFRRHLGDAPDNRPGELHAVVAVGMAMFFG
jgi:hypothetical protein